MEGKKENELVVGCPDADSGEASSSRSCTAWLLLLSAETEMDVALEDGRASASGLCLSVAWAELSSALCLLAASSSERVSSCTTSVVRAGCRAVECVEAVAATADAEVGECAMGLLWWWLAVIADGSAADGRKAAELGGSWPFDSNASRSTLPE